MGSGRLGMCEANSYIYHIAILFDPLMASPTPQHERLDFRDVKIISCCERINSISSQRTQKSVLLFILCCANAVISVQGIYLIISTGLK